METQNIKIPDLTLLAQQLRTEMPVLDDKITKAIQSTSITPQLALEEVLKFLFLIHKHNTVLTPSLNVDLAWHEFILCTRLYHAFCDQHFGRYIHHSPGGDERENEKKFLNTIRLYSQTFGAPNPLVWGEFAYQEWEASQCGACQSN